MVGRRMVAVGVVTAAVAVGGVAGALIGIPGLSGASSSPTAATPASSGSSSGSSSGYDGPRVRGPFGGVRSDVMDAAAKALNLTTQQLLQKLSDGKTTIADVAGQQHVGVQTVIAAMEAVANTDISNLVNNPLPQFGKGGGRPGPAAGIRFGLGFGLRGGLRSSADDVAKALGISTQDLANDLRNGQSIADIAKSKSVDLDTIINTLVNDAKQRIDAAVKANKLPQAAATKLESNLQQEITDLVNGKGPGGLGFFGGMHGRGGMGLRFGGRFGFGPGGGPGANAESPSSGPAV